MVSVASVGMSPREAEVLEALSDGLTNAQIGQRLHISVRTVESHVSSLLRKLGAADRRDLAARAAGTLAAVPVATEDLVGLPATWTTFVGRTVELDQLDKALATDRLVTLVGPGGVGKTRLAVMAAARAASTFFAGGAFVDLVPVSPEFVVETVAAALGVVERAPVPLDQAVLARLRAGRVLLVLDNCEHVLAATAAFTRSVLAACPEAVVLATSRQSLGVAGERVVPLDPLALTGEGGDGAVSDAERLFVERATSAAGAIADPALIGEICRRLDGMPLAIELAAARSSSLGLDGLLAGLDDHLRLLSRSTDPGDRHRSMRTVIEWSHQLLDDEERAVFRRLSLFAGAFDLDAAATVAGEGDVATTSDIIGRLADKSLLVRLGAPTGSRWRMLDTVDAYAGAQLEASGEEDAVRRRYLVWATATARQIEGSLDIDGAWRDRFDAVADDLRAALLAAAPASATQAPDESAGFELALALGHLSYARRFLVEARDHLGTAVARAPSEESAVDALRMAASAAFAEMRGKTAFDLLQTAFDRASAAGNDRAAAIALAQASAIAGRCSALFVDPLSSDEIAGFIARARALAPPDDLEVETYIAVAVAWDATHGLSLPNPAGADAALVLARRLGDPVLISIALDAVSAAAAEDGCYKQAARVTEERFTLLDRLPRHDPRFGGEVADIFHMGAESALAAGELREALENAQRSYDDSTNQGLRPFLGEPSRHPSRPAGGVRLRPGAGDDHAGGLGASRPTGLGVDGAVVLRRRHGARPARRPGGVRRVVAAGDDRADTEEGSQLQPLRRAPRGAPPRRPRLGQGDGGDRRR